MSADIRRRTHLLCSDQCQCLRMFALVGIVTLLTLIYFVWTRWDVIKLTWKLPGPLPLPLVGAAYNILGKNHEDYLEMVEGMFKKYSSFHHFWLGPRFYLLISDPKLIQSVLFAQEALNRDDVYDFVSLLGDGGGLLTLKGQTWKNHRKNLNPCFSLKILQSYMPIFNEQAGIMMKNMNARLNKGSFNFYEFMDACTLDMICQTTLGTEMNIQKGQNQDYLYACNNLFELITIRIFRPWFHSDFLFKFSDFHKTTEKLRKITSNFVEKVIVNKASSDEETKGHKSERRLSEDELTSYKKPQIFIDQVMEMHKEGKLETMVDVKAHVGTNIATGFETSALISSYCVLMLAMHPKIQQKVYEEIEGIFGKDCKNPVVEYEHFNRLEYLDRVLKETLRLFPVVPYFARKVSKDFNLAGHKVPAGVRIMISMITVHHDKEIWGEDAEKFNPDNFLPERVQTRHPYSYFPFGGGIRNCIGMKYSLMSMKTMIIHLLSNYRLSTELRMEDLRTKIDVTLKLINKHMVSIEAR
ncbi:cytochrome P450 4c21-like [Phlebotomus argentipes]|uniref:cytochrome P450 4c21-like n=1 Tax=Phlebotomus argentipes TaxID=94469 RepID=UPI00289374DF|nr:cytochrome P450 4c21-like [Phlebotomus argentipes]